MIPYGKLAERPFTCILKTKQYLLEICFSILTESVMISYFHARGYGGGHSYKITVGFSAGSLGPHRAFAILATSYSVFFKDTSCFFLCKCPI